MKRSMSTLALVTTLVPGLLCTAAGSVEAQTMPKVFYACYVPTSGTTYRIKEPGTKTQCQSGHVAFSWTDGVGAVRVGDAAGGDLSGTYPNPTVAKLQGQAVSAAAPTSGQVLIWNGTAWTPATPATVLTDHGALSGLTDDDHPQYLLTDGVRTATTGFAVMGTPGSGTIPASGAGTRLMWYPGKAAFRVGGVEADQWDDANVGEFSTAMGFTTTASRQGSSAIGYRATASGEVSTAIGYRATATGPGSISIGSNTTTSGIDAVAMGALTTASGHRSTAMGWSVSTNFREGSFIYGDNQGREFEPPTNVTANNSFVVRAQRVWFGKSGDQVATLGRYIETSTGAYLSDGGDWTNASDVNRKQNFQDEDAGDVLERLSRLPIRSWSYKAEHDSIRHLGPTAQDFYAAFRLGDSDIAIGTVDAAGVALLAIQALEQRTRDLDDLRARVDALVRANELLSAEVAALRAAARRP